MTNVSPFMAYEDAISAFAIKMDKAEKWKADDADWLTYPTMEQVGFNLKRLLADGVEKERIGWTTMGKDQYIILIRKNR